MKKYLQNFWVRFLACILCSVTLLAVIIAGGMLVFSAYLTSNMQEIDDNMHDRISQHYASYICDNLGPNTLTDPNDILETDGFCYAVYETLEDGEEKLLYSNLANADEWDYSYTITEGTILRYNINSLWNIIRMGEPIAGVQHMSTTSITGYVFDMESGLFYYKTESGYFFKVDYIRVDEQGEIYDYKLKGNEYYNSYYNRTLNILEYDTWNWVEINSMKCTLSTNATGNEIQVVTNSSAINNLIYTDIYYEGEKEIQFYKNTSEGDCIIRIKENDTKVAGLYEDWELFKDNIIGYESSATLTLTLCVIFFCIAFALFIYSSDDDEEKLGIMHRIPLFIYLICILSIESLIGLGAVACVEYIMSGAGVFSLKNSIQLILLIVGVGIFIGFIALSNLITRIRTKTFWKYSEFSYAVKLIRWAWKKLTTPFAFFIDMIQNNTSLAVRGLLAIGLITFAEFLVIILFYHGAGILFFCLIKVAEAIAFLGVLRQMQLLQEGSERIAAGNLEEPIRTEHMLPSFRQHGENINKVRDSITIAVEERMKSERFKTELITNVSHDIKTPLTSIINYVDLIKKEQIEDEKLCGYIEVLDRQSSRLKKLIEDLMEASKASTGNLTVNMEECNVDVLLSQIIGEFETKLTENNLEVVVEKPEMPIWIKADGRHIWRVLDNLFHNICKYSMPGTRVYIGMKKDADTAEITFKNISKSALNIPSSELMERFVRGDSSRNTEGSGLGLSIAQSLTELMNGSMELEIDGDLFKVTLHFQIIEK